MSPSDSVRRVGPLERTLFLRTISGAGFDALDPADVAIFAENTRESSFAAGESILRPGEPVCCVHVIIEGAVRVVGGEYPNPTDFGVRGSFGFPSMLSGQPSGLDAIATEDTLALAVDDDHFYDILEDNFSILLNVVRMLARVTLAERRLSPPGTYLAPAEGLLDKSAADSLDLVERIVLIRRPGSPFEHSSLEALARLARLTPEVRFRPGEVLWRAGDPADHTLILVAGTVACTAPDGRELFRAGPGYPLGNLERFTDDPRWFTATTETEVLALQGESEAFLDLIEDHFDMARDFISTMARNLLSIRRGLAEKGLELAKLPGQQGR